jgi:HAD superfamily hydrolase (TIGR01509 family)
MKRISAVIFDCDGVLFDSRQANVNYYNQVLAYFDLPAMTEDAVEFVHSHTADESIRHIFSGTSLLEQAQAYRKHIDYTPFIKDMVMEPGLKELLRMLKPQYGLAIATNRSDTIGKVLESNGLTGYFDIVVSSLDVQNPKPHPESIYRILDFFHLQQEQCLYVGDSLVDWQTARAAGVTLVAYQNDALETPWQVKNLLAIKDILDILGKG